MTVLQTSAELIAHGLFQAHESTDGTSDYAAAAVRYLNKAYRAVSMGGNEWVRNRNPLWWWLRGEASIILQPGIETGSVSVTNNSASATLSATQAISLAGRFFKVDGHFDVFRINAHTAGTDALTLDTVYTGTTNTAAAYKALKLEYDLASDSLYIESPMRVYGTRHQVDGMSLRDLDVRYPLDLVSSGQPEHFAMVDDDTVRFSHSGGDEATEFFRVDYDYVKRADDLADDSNEALIPLQYRYLLADMITVFIAIDKDENDDAQFFGDSARNTIGAMIAEHNARLGKQGEVGRIYTRQTERNRQYPLRTQSGHIIG